MLSPWFKFCCSELYTDAAPKIPFSVHLYDGYNSYQMCKAISVAFFFNSSLLQGVTIERSC